MTRLKRRGNAVAFAGTAVFCLLLFQGLSNAGLSDFPSDQKRGSLSVSIDFFSDYETEDISSASAEKTENEANQSAFVPLKDVLPPPEKMHTEAEAQGETGGISGCLEKEKDSFEQMPVPLLQSQENAAEKNGPAEKKSGRKKNARALQEAGSRIRFQDKSMRQLLEPEHPSIYISEESARLAGSTRSVFVRLKILADGTVPRDEIFCVPPSQLPVQVQDEIKAQVCRWKFSQGTEGTASFQYTLEIEY